MQILNVNELSVNSREQSQFKIKKKTDSPIEEENIDFDIEIDEEQYDSNFRIQTIDIKQSS